MKKMQLRSTLMVPLITATAFLVSFRGLARVKIGSDPTVISVNANLQVQATNATPFITQKSNGFVGLNIPTPSNLAHVFASAASQGRQVDLKDSTSSIYVGSDGGITVRRVGSAKALAPHVGGYT